MYFTEQHEMARKLAKDFGKRYFTREFLDKVEETHEFPREIYMEMAKAGFFGIKFPKELGGSGADQRTYVVIMEEIAKASGVASIYLSSPNSLMGTPIQMVGTPEQKEKYLSKMISGEKIFCFGLTEPEAGSDAAAMATTAVQEGDYWIINGTKTFITAAPLADYCVVFAKTSPEKGAKGITSFIMDMKSPGVTCGKPEDKMGMIGCATSDITMENVKVHKSDVLGKVDLGFITAMKTLEVGRLGIAAQAIGLASAALDEALQYSKDRKQFGKPIGTFQSIAFDLAEMETKLQAAKLMTYNAAYLLDTGKPGTKACSMAKLFASEVCNEICAKAVQIHGGYGFIKEYKVERLYRDARVLTIYEGTSQIQKLVISSHLMKEKRN